MLRIIYCYFPSMKRHRLKHDIVSIAASTKRQQPITFLANPYFGNHSRIIAINHWNIRRHGLISRLPFSVRILLHAEWIFVPLQWFVNASQEFIICYYRDPGGTICDTILYMVHRGCFWIIVAREGYCLAIWKSII